MHPLSIHSSSALHGRFTFLQCNCIRQEYMCWSETIDVCLNTSIFFFGFARITLALQTLIERAPANEVNKQKDVKRQNETPHHSLYTVQKPFMRTVFKIVCTQPGNVPDARTHLSHTESRTHAGLSEFCVE